VLRFLALWREPVERKRGYDAVVILAHSQGCVITADALRFLHAEAKRELALLLFR